MDSNKKLLSISIPDSLYQALKNYQQQQQLEEPTSAVIEILTQFFQLGEEIEPDATAIEDTKSYATQQQLKALENQVANLSKQVDALRQVLASYTSTTPQAMSAVAGYSPTQITNSVPQTQVVAAMPSFEEIEDEPDEILYDFL
ncbi:MAG: hypothetical protein F6J89_23455 [Symploca sp. SIO1C4]|uniref:Uncharacterized protein n=1 Tax=Symploca sp. SIO1C4 TaxID=2607765 RepID=A0A6B3NK48_9CYAN|nr:hypothetical protein [Symploca sp. SIO1C4]